jgi:hypothetical protein
MSIKHRAALRLAALALPALLICGTAAARDLDRTDRNDDRTTGSGSQFEEPMGPQAPIGHRQPRAAELPAAMSPTAEDEWIDRLNRNVDRKLQICRGC